MKNLVEIYEYREMIFSLVHRDLRGRYKGSVLGFFWTFLNPLLQLMVYTMVFSVILKNGIEEYYIFLFVALVPWIFFSSCLTGGSTCVLSHQNMVKKIYFPREVLPISYVLSTFINMILSFLVVFAVLIFSGFGVNPKALLYLPVIMLIELLLALGITFLTSSLCIYFRDIQYILAILSMAWQFFTPIVYKPEQVEGALPDNLYKLWKLNPMNPITIAYRQILYYKQTPDMRTLGEAVVFGMIFLVVGYVVYRQLQRGFAEEL